MVGGVVVVVSITTKCNCHCSPRDTPLVYSYHSKYLGVLLKREARGGMVLCSLLQQCRQEKFMFAETVYAFDQVPEALLQVGGL